MAILRKIPLFILLVLLSKWIGYAATSADTVPMQLLVSAFYCFGIFLSAWFVRKNTVNQQLFVKLNGHDYFVIVRNLFLQFVLYRLLRFLGVYLGLNGHSVNQAAILQHLQDLSVAELVLMFSFIIVWGPIFEELVFRGYVMNAFTKKKLTLGMGLVSALIFAYLHLQTLFISWDNLLVFVLYFKSGLLLALTYRQTKKLTASMAQHAISNVIVSIPVIIWLVNG
ncbi:CPBP family intramembrane metalloprotease [Fructobacillus sp. M1-13]|uniref:CPBP family intramembrane metalloprotease n=1 Tax=Fructobacillus papyriferae TaxID=2713171 RepID=A0ABS5QPZ1_9LACO|nr:type II CAAX endopeptidase family protein [Fructobacillus papyriferae]MBS9335248.1 CPBP family intramembrane metalloprotease [Fructobacillus papyriferae]MCD2159083.1 CPBP family intramembrane metalloprotease [Fructobacillus papyriferae]